MIFDLNFHNVNIFTFIFNLLGCCHFTFMLGEYYHSRQMYHVISEDLTRKSNKISFTKLISTSQPFFCAQFRIKCISGGLSELFKNLYGREIFRLLLLSLSLKSEMTLCRTSGSGLLEINCSLPSSLFLDCAKTQFMNSLSSQAIGKVAAICWHFIIYQRRKDQSAKRP